MDNFQQLLSSSSYSFLKTNEHLGENIILLGLGGSHAYGTNVEGSDLDIRGIALNRKEEILTNENFEQFVNDVRTKNEYGKNLVLKAQNQHYFRFKNIEITTKNVLLKNTKKGN